MCRTSIYDARNNFSSLVKRAEGGEPVELTRHDKPVAVIISWQEYAARQRPDHFFEWLEQFKKENADVFEGFEGLEIDEDRPIDEAYEKKIAALWSEV